MGSIMEERVKAMLGPSLKPEMKTMMQELGENFKFPEWKYRMNKLDSCSSEAASMFGGAAAFPAASGGQKQASLVGTIPKQSLLHELVGIDRLEKVAKQLDKGTDVNVLDCMGETPLFWAVSAEAVDFLVTEGARIEHRNSLCQCSAFYKFACQGQHKPLKALALHLRKAGVLEKYLDEPASITKRTPLHAAAHNGFLQTVKELLSMGADRDAEDYLGKKALDLARDRGFDEASVCEAWYISPVKQKRFYVRLVAGIDVIKACAHGCECVPQLWKWFSQKRSVESMESMYKGRVNQIGMVNEQAVYFATKSGVSMLHEGLLTPAVERHDAELVAFHMCHHRSSIFYEVLSKDGGVLTIYEYSLLVKESVKVAIFQETVPAKSLCCVDNLLLRASRASLLAVSLSPAGHGAPPSILQKFKDAEQDVLGSLAVAFAADVVQHAHVYAVAPRNRSVVKLRLQEDTHGILHLTSIEELLAAGEGADGPTETASVVQPHQVAWVHGKLLLADGCSLRQVEEGRVTTLLGSPTECVDAANETLSPADWVSRISQPLGLAAEAEATAGHTVLVLTRGQVIQVTQQEEGTCTGSSHDACTKEECGWVEDDRHNRCLSCSALHAWAEAQRPPMDPCLQLTGAGFVRYDLGPCGCVAPTTTPAPEEDIGVAGFVRVVVVLGVASGVLFYCWRERQRRRLQQDMYGLASDTVQFHTFNDQDHDCYVRHDSHDTFS
ncbi:ANKRA2 [Symbiodinium pilosum]|uniref:ANKRA2 protein n=1 Tax=Symbiodinium pilosum TaxID=2952 RepID=A0A812XGP9_SYMPI|nr:ANKRA2 [Symbiodinium pilosum]